MSQPCSAAHKWAETPGSPFGLPYELSEDGQLLDQHILRGLSSFGVELGGLSSGVSEELKDEWQGNFTAPNELTQRPNEDSLLELPASFAPRFISDDAELEHEGEPLLRALDRRRAFIIRDVYVLEAA